MKSIKLLIMAAVAMLAAACCPCRRAGGSPNPPATGRQWSLVSFDGTRQAAADNFNITFGSDGRVTGVGACNRISGTYTVSPDGRLTFGALVATRMFCADQEKEDRFLRALGSVDGYVNDLRTNTLMLLHDGLAVLVFEGRNP